MKTYAWSWTERRSDIRIYEDNNVIGFIYSFFEKKVSKIKGKKFFVDYPPKMHRTFISNPVDKKAFCEITLHTYYPKYKIKSDSFEYIYDRTGNIFIGKKIFLTKDNKKTLELIIPKGIFPVQGTINVFDSEHIEMGIYCLFYLYSIQDPRDSD